MFRCSWQTSTVIEFGNLSEQFGKGGFHVAHIVLDASEFGVSQKRRRAFFLVTKQPVDAQVVLERLKKFKTDPVGAREALNGLSNPKVRPDDYDDDVDYGGVHNHVAMRHSEQVMKKDRSH